MEVAEKAKTHVEHAFSQFELSKNVLHNLKHFDLTPTGKLVLLVLVDCYNPENNAVVFPSMEFIADMAGIGLTATKQAIKDLILTGCIIKSKRGKIRGNYNKYLLTKKIRSGASERVEIKDLNKSDNEKSQISKNDCLKSSEIDCFKKSDSDRFHEEQKIEQKNNNVVDIKNFSESEKKTDAQILAQYAKEHGATNVQGYVNSLKLRGAADRIISLYREQERIKRSHEITIRKGKEQVAEYERFKREAEPPSQSWKELGEILRKMKQQS